MLNSQDIWKSFDIDNNIYSWNKRTVMSDYHVMFDTFLTQFFNQDLILDFNCLIAIFFVIIS